MTGTQAGGKYGRFIRVDSEVRAAIDERRAELQLGFDLAGKRHSVTATEALADLLSAPDGQLDDKPEGLLA